MLSGPRGSGKSDGLLLDFAQHVGVGFGPSWRGILFRRSYKELGDLVAKSKKWFPLVFPGCKFNETNFVWKFREGEELHLRHLDNPMDYWIYHGHEYPWVGWDELTQWPTSESYEAGKSFCRSSDPRVPLKYRATTNPSGPGHSWVKRYFVDPAPSGTPIVDEKSGLTRVCLKGSLYENDALLGADPNYLSRLESITDPIKRKAWIEGSWDIVSGGAIDDLWTPAIHVIPPFPIIPHSWRVDRSFDWGSSRPFSVGWWAESNGETVEIARGVFKTYPARTLFRIGEFYGWNGNPNEGCKMLAGEVAREIKRIEQGFDFIVRPGPADSSIYDADRGVSIADEMGRNGVTFLRADKRPGSRVAGLEMLRTRLKASLTEPMEEPGIFIFENCSHFIRTVPVLPRDPKNPDAFHVNCEDHVADEVRYRCLSRARTGVISQTVW